MSPAVDPTTNHAASRVTNHAASRVALNGQHRPPTDLQALGLAESRRNVCERSDALLVLLQRCVSGRNQETGDGMDNRERGASEQW